jgi:ABC-type antimicrobial peptide transport system permease subunit
MDGDLRPFTVVGIVGDVRDAGLDAPPRAILYANHRQRLQFGQSLVVHTDGDPAKLAAPVRAALREVAPDMPTRFQTAHEILAAAMSQRRAALLLIGAFAAMALLLSVSGVYGALSYSVTQQTREIGIRAALGAHATEIAALVLRQGLAVVGLGIAAGIAVALAAARVLRTHLFGVQPADPVTLAGAAALLALVAVFACYLPARRAARVDPVIALRAE